MDTEKKTKILELFPSVKFIVRLVVLSVLGWAFLFGVYYLYKLQNKMSYSSNMGAGLVGGGPAGKGDVSEKKLSDLGAFDVETHIKYGSQCMDAGDPEEALRHFVRAELLIRHDPALYKKIGDSFLMLEKYKEAEKAYRDALKEDKNNSAIVSQLGLALLFQNRIDDGIALIEQSIGLDSACGECYSALARAYSSISPEHKGVVEAFYHSMSLSSEKPESYYYYAKYLMNHSQYAEAYPILKHIVSNFPLFGKGHARLGIASYYLKNYKQAQTEYELALQVNPNDFNTWYNLGELFYAANNDSMAAMRCFKKVTELDPNHSGACFRMGLIFFRNKQYKEALNKFETALETEPDDVDILFQLAVSYERLELQDKAAETYNRILQINPLNNVAKQKLDIITSGFATH
jgi:tetratricopeptide (TPR) repeat protein